MKRVLIVDDALDFGRMLQAAVMTVDPNLACVVVPSAEEALLETVRRPADLLVTDVRLPGMSGLDLVRKMRTRNATVKVIIVSGIGDARVKQQIQDSNPDRYFRKPVDITPFLDAVKECLGYAAPAAKVEPEVEVAAAPQEETPPEERSSSELISDVIAGLRKSLGAQAVLLLDDRGRIMVQAGDLPEKALDGEWSGPLLASVSASAKLSRLMGADMPSTVLAARGKSYDLVLAPIGDYALAILLKLSRSSLRLAISFEEALVVQPQLVVLLEQMGVLLKAAEMTSMAPESALVKAEETVENETDLEAFEALFNKPGGGSKPKTHKRDDADAFWSSLMETKGKAGSEGEGLSYEQATSLGLAPETEAPAPAAPAPKKAAAAPQPVQEEKTVDLDSLEALLKQAGAEKPAQQVDASTFWDSATEVKTKISGNPDMLTYEEAMRLGLAPGSEES